ncbi:uncharacterized protein Dyak_GE27537 [Drosophila yakuba]|uniref:Uncharacterized protein n=1 Tax=Drosophila yakuba TaxID=7245 RepID=A0A0R1E930_DROYA|nr:uncharacterized protein Dyak_GE27537 [Drosophila yakuba]
MQQLLGELDDEAAGMTDGLMAALVTQYLKDASEGMRRLSRVRTTRAIEDWSTILKAQNEVVTNTDQQIRINSKLFDSAHESALLINKVVQRVNAIDGDLQATALTLHRAIILANQVGEIIKACQFAKTGTVNSNLLDHEEVETILNEVSNLPYQNAIEAIEFSRPSVVTNGTMILYILAFPKVTTESYKFMHLYSTISEGRQVVLEHNKLAASPDETYAVLGGLPIYRQHDRLPGKGPPQTKRKRLHPSITGGNAACKYLKNDQEVVKSIDDGTLSMDKFHWVQ